MPRSGSKQGNKSDGKPRPGPNVYGLRARRKAAARAQMLENIARERKIEEDERKLKALMLAHKQ